MGKEGLLQIGEVAKLSHISVGSLRHYEKLGLLTPEYVDENSGYRYYNIRQFERLNTIRYLRVLGMPLPEIAGFMQNRNLGKIQEMLCQQKAEVARRQEEAVVFLGKVGVGIPKEWLDGGKYDRYGMVFLILDEEDQYAGDVEELPGEICATICFQGSHMDAPAYYKRLCGYIAEQGWEIAGFSKETTLIDFGFTNDPGQFVTEIQIPVLR